MTEVLSIGFIAAFLYTFCAFSSILMAIQFALRYGAVTGFIAGLGNATAQIVWILVAMSAVSLSAAVLKTDIHRYRFIPVIILFALGMKLLIFKSKPPREINNRFRGHVHAYLTVFTIAISTPNRILGYFAILVLIGASMIASHHFFFKSNMLLSMLAGIISWWILFAFVINKLKIVSVQNIQWLQKIIGFILIILAIGLCFVSY